MFRTLFVLSFHGRLRKYNIKIASQRKIKFLTKVPLAHFWSLVCPVHCPLSAFSDTRAPVLACIVSPEHLSCIMKKNYLVNKLIRVPTWKYFCFKITLQHDCRTNTWWYLTTWNSKPKYRRVRERKISSVLSKLCHLNDTHYPPSWKSRLFPRIVVTKKNLACVKCRNKLPVQSPVAVGRLPCSLHSGCYILLIANQNSKLRSTLSLSFTGIRTPKTDNILNLIQHLTKFSKIFLCVSSCARYWGYKDKRSPEIRWEPRYGSNELKDNVIRAVPEETTQSCGSTEMRVIESPEKVSEDFL